MGKKLFFNFKELAFKASLFYDDRPENLFEKSEKRFINQMDNHNVAKSVNEKLKINLKTLSDYIEEITASNFS